MNKKVVVIGAGFGGLGSAILLARAGYDVTVVEKNDKVGGRANLLEIDGYRRDMGPSWYLMPDAFDRYFTAIGRKVEDYLDLQKLEPSYRVFFKPSSSSGGGTTKEPVSRNGYNTLDSSASLHSVSEGQAKYLDLYADVDKAVTTFEGIEPNSGDKLRAYLKSAAYQYGIAMEKFVFKNFDSIWDFMTPQLAIEGLQLNVFTKLYNYVSRFVKNENLKKLLMYPSVFLGTSPYETPALFNIMSHVDFNQGVFYPQGGIHEIPKALYQIALEEGVKFEFNAEVEKIVVEDKVVRGVQLKSKNNNIINVSLIPGLISAIQYPLMIHGKNKSGASYFTIELVEQLIKTGKKVLFFSKYQTAKDSLMNKGLNYTIVSSIDDVDDSDILIFGHGDIDGFSQFMDSFNKTDYIVIVKNAEYFSQKQISGFLDHGLCIVSGDLSNIAISNSRKGDRILFSDINKTRIGNLRQYDALYLPNVTVSSIIDTDIANTNISQESDGCNKTVEHVIPHLIHIHNFFTDMLTSHSIPCYLGGGLGLSLIVGAIHRLPKDLDYVVSHDNFLRLEQVFTDENISYTFSSKGSIIIKYDGFNVEFESPQSIEKFILQQTGSTVSIINCFDSEEVCVDGFTSRKLKPDFYRTIWNVFGGAKYPLDEQMLNNTIISADIIISNADMRHTETQLLEVSQQTYPESYWAKQVISPSGFILYLGVDGELPQLKHHTLVFSDDWRGGFDQIFKDPQRPQDPNYYICNPSKTDPSVAPAGKENLFVLVPIAPGLDSTPESLEAYRDHIIADIAHNCGIPDLQDRIEVSQIFSIPQFEQYYNAYKGTALGLAHTFFQSAVRRPQNYSKKVRGLYYAGGYTTPGIGMPMCLISAMMVADRVEKNK